MKWGFAPAADFCSLQINVFPSWRKCYQAAGSRSSWAAEGWTALGSSVRARPPSDLRPPVWSERVHPELNVDAADLTGRRHVWCDQIPDKDQQVLIKTESRVKTSDRNSMAAQKHSWNKKTPCFSLLCSFGHYFQVTCWRTSWSCLCCFITAEWNKSAAVKTVLFLLLTHESLLIINHKY